MKLYIVKWDEYLSLLLKGYEVDGATRRIRWKVVAMGIEDARSVVGGPDLTVEPVGPAPEGAKRGILSKETINLGY